MTCTTTIRRGSRNLLLLVVWLSFVSPFAGVARAAVDLIAAGSISGTYEDFATETAAPLENGIPGNRLGGMGSGLAYAGGNTFLALPDRGPNAKAYNSAVDDTTSYIARFHTLNLSLAPSDAGSPLPFTLTPMLVNTTLLSSETPLVYGTGAGVGLGSGAPALNAVDDTHYFTGRSDNFDPSKSSTNPANARLDPEGIRVASDGRSVFISDEYGPYVYEFDRASGRRIRAFTLPTKFAVSRLSAVGAAEISGNTAGRVANKGMEGLAITPDGRRLVGIMQNSLIQDGGPTVRIVAIDIESGETREYAYTLTTGSGVSEIVAVNNHQFLVDERDGKGLGDGSTATVKQIFLIDLKRASDVSGLTGEANLVPLAVPKTLFLDVVTVLGAHGISTSKVPAKIEGLAFGQDVIIDGRTKHTLYVANDNDYNAVFGGLDNPNAWFVFAFDDTDLPGFAPQQLKQEHEAR